MCRPSDPLCLMVPALESLGSALPYRPLPVAVVNDLMGRPAPRLPAHLSRALFLPKHTSQAIHLPIYDITEVYTQKMRDTPFGSNAYQINLMFLPRPKGDGTDGDVRFFANVDPERNLVTVEQRSPSLSRGKPVTVNLPGESRGPALLTAPDRQAYRIHATQAGARASAETSGQPADPKARRYPSLTVEPLGSSGGDNDDEAATEWYVRPEGPGAVCYRLLARRRRAAAAEAPPPWEVKAVYHHAGAHLEHPVDTSEGVLLLPAVEDAHEDMAALALVWVLLWHIRALGAEETHSLFSRLLRRWHARK